MPAKIRLEILVLDDVEDANIFIVIFLSKAAHTLRPTNVTLHPLCTVIKRLKLSVANLCMISVNLIFTGNEKRQANSLAFNLTANFRYNG